MIIDNLSIIGISDTNPIQFWPSAADTYNESTIKLVDLKKYYQKFLFHEQLYNRLDVMFSSRRYEDWDSATPYLAGTRVWHPVSFVRYEAVIDNTNHDPQDETVYVGTYWKVLAADAAEYNAGTVYNPGDRAAAWDGVQGFILYESISVGNVGHTPVSSPDDWDQVKLVNGQANLRIWLDGEVNASIPFTDIPLFFVATTHQYVNWLWETYSDIENKRISLDVYDPTADAILAKSDCMGIQTEIDQPSVNIEFTNSANFNGLIFETINPTFYIRLDCLFFQRRRVKETENNDLTNGVIVALTKKMTSKQLLKIIEHLPDYMHEKMEQIFMCDGLTINDLPWKADDEYVKTETDETATLCRAEILLTQQNSVLVNTSLYDPFSAGRVFSGEFPDPFA